jgi:serine/threonine-protein kinase
MTHATASERLVRAIPARLPSPDAPRNLCGWRCERLLGEGRLTRVFAAQPSEALVGRSAPYALKMLREPWQNDARAIGALRRDAWLGEHVSHVHLAPTLAAQMIDPPFFMVTPLLRGRSLAAMLTAGDAPPLSLAVWIARQIAEALETLDDAGWLHGDLCPSRVFVSPEAHVTLRGLGSAVRTGEPARLGERPVLGPPRYLAPEMFSATARIDARSDIYSLGVLLLEMLIGRPWSDEIGPAAAPARPRDLTSGTVRRFVPAAPSRLARLIGQMMAGDPLRRPQNARELIDRLASIEIETFAEHLGSELPRTN